jgi:pimeloyl-ACP methyl ester carboxylesterase
VNIWHGTADRVAPLAMAERLAQAIPPARLRAADGLGHVSLLQRMAPEILESLLEGWSG